METLVITLNKSTETLINEKLEILSTEAKEQSEQFIINKKKLLPFIGSLAKRLVDINNLVEYKDCSGVSIGGDCVRRLLRKDKIDFQDYFDLINVDSNYSSNGIVFGFKDLDIKIWLNINGKMNYTNLEYSLSYLGYTPKSIDALINMILDNILPKKV